MNVLMGAAIAGLVALVVLHFGSIVLVLRRLSRRRDEARTPPSDGVSILVPVCGLEYALERTLTSFFHIEAPRYEVVFCVTDEDDSAIPLVRRLIDGRPKVPARLLIGGEVGVNPKVDNLLKGWDAATHDWVVLCDSNLLVPPDYLTRLFERWSERTGFVSSSLVGIDVQNAGAELEAAFLNTLQARWQLAFDELGRCKIQCKTILLRRSDLAEQGGLAALRQELSEGDAVTKIALRRGREVHLAVGPLAQPLGSRGFAEVWRRQSRWAGRLRLAYPMAYARLFFFAGGLPTFTLAFGLALAGLLPWAGLLALVVLWYAAEVPLARGLGVPPKLRTPVFWILRDCLLPILWARGWRMTTYVWRGRVIDVADARAAPVSDRDAPSRTSAKLDRDRS